MAKKKIDKNVKDMTRAEWLNLRREGIGGSDAGAIMGLNRYSSPVKVWMDKTGRGRDKDIDSDSMRFGRDMEEYVAKRWEEASGKRVRRNNYMLMHDEYPFMLADLDREVVGENAILECKTANAFMADDWKGDNIPQHYVIQCLHYLAVTGADKCYLACMIGNGHMEYRCIDRDETAINIMIKREKEFWENYVIANQMPPADGSENADNVLLESYPAVDESREEIEILSVKSLDRYDEVCDLLDSLAKEKKKIEQIIKMEMEDAQYAFIGDRHITWKARKGSSRIDGKTLHKEKPEIYERYLKVGKPTRVFKIQSKE